MTTTEWESVQQIIKSYPGYAYKAQRSGYIQADTPFHQALHAHFEHEMPYDMATGDVGDPDEWIENQLEDLGFFDKPITGGY